jgi:hypothetical protein
MVALDEVWCSLEVAVAECAGILVANVEDSASIVSELLGTHKVLRECLNHHEALLSRIEAEAEVSDKPFGELFLDRIPLQDRRYYESLRKEPTAADLHQWLAVWAIHDPNPIVPIQAALAVAYSLYLKEHTYVVPGRCTYPQYILLLGILGLPEDERLQRFGHTCY